MSDIEPPGGWPEGGFPGSGSNDDTSHFVMGKLNLNHLGDVHARRYLFDTYPNAGGPSYSPLQDSILVWWDGDSYNHDEPGNEGPDHDAWIVREGVDLGNQLGVPAIYHTTHTFDSKIATANQGYGVGDDFAGIWMEMYRFSFSRSSLIGWEIYHNGLAISRIRLFKTDYSSWNSTNLIDITDNKSPLNQNDSSRVLGGGQGSGSGFRRKAKDASSGFLLQNPNQVENDMVVMGGPDSPDFTKDEILVCELQNFQPTNGDPTNLLTLILEWRIEST
jgi:hypothetical protein